MGIEYREELVGKRFLCVVGNSKPKTEISQWPWRAGIIRAVDKTQPAVYGKEAIVYVEFDDQDWDKREWLKISNKSHQVFLVEKTAVWAERVDPYAAVPNDITWPALNFKPLVDRCGFKDSSVKPVEFFLDNLLDFYKKADIEIYKDTVKKLTNKPIFKRYPDVKLEFHRWLHEQREQHILMKAPYALSGYRVKVYRIGSTTQWFTAVITGHNLMTKDLIVMDDTVLESHTENPAHVHMMFLDDVVNSLLKGENVGITPRRRAAAAVTASSTSQPTSLSTFSRSLTSSQPSAPSSTTNSAPQGPKKRKTTKGDSPAELEQKVTKPEKPARTEKPSSNKNKRERKRKPDETISNDRKTQPENSKKTKPNANALATSTHVSSHELQGPAHDLNASTENSQGCEGILQGPEADSRVPPGDTQKDSPAVDGPPSEGPSRVREEDGPPESERTTEMLNPEAIAAVQSNNIDISSNCVPSVSRSVDTTPASCVPTTVGSTPPLKKLSVSMGSVNAIELQHPHRTIVDSRVESSENAAMNSRQQTSIPSAVVSTCPSRDTISKPPPVVSQSPINHPPVSASRTPVLSEMGSDAGFLLKLSQAISINPNRRPKTERDSPFNTAIAGIIARELNRDNEKQPQKVSSENPPRDHISSSSSGLVPRSAVMTSAASKLYGPMQSMMRAQVSAQEAVIPAVPSEAMVKNCLMKSSTTVNPKPAPSTPVFSDPGRQIPSTNKVARPSSTPQASCHDKLSPADARGPKHSRTTSECQRPSSERPTGVDLRTIDVQSRSRTNKMKSEQDDRDIYPGTPGRYEMVQRLKEEPSSRSPASSRAPPVRVFRDPTLMDNPVTHVHSIQHNFHHSQLGKPDRHKQQPPPPPPSSQTLHSSSSLRTAAGVAAHRGPLPGSPSAFIPSNIHSNALQTTLLPPPLGLYPHPLGGMAYNILPQHMGELLAHQDAVARLRHQQQAALLQAQLGPAQLQALLQGQPHGMALPPGLLVPHSQEELDLLRTQRDQQKLHAEKLAQLETEAILHADKHLFSSSPHLPQPTRPQPTSSAGSGHAADMYRAADLRGNSHLSNHLDLSNHRDLDKQKDLPMVDVKAAIERHFRESLGKPNTAFPLAAAAGGGYGIPSGSITRGTPLPKTDPRIADKEMQHKEQLEQERLRREREEKELEWQRLQREKEYKQNQLQKEMERKIMFPGHGITSEQERIPKLVTSMEGKTDDLLLKHVMNQLKPKYSGLSLADTLVGEAALLQSSSAQGFQVFQPYKTHKSGFKYEDARPGIPIRTEHNRLKHSPSYMSAFQVQPHHLEGYEPFKHTVISGKAHEEKDKSLHVNRGATHSPHRVTHSPHGPAHTAHLIGHSQHGAGHPSHRLVAKERTSIPCPPPLIKKEPGVVCHDYRMGHEFQDDRNIHEVSARTLWEKQIGQVAKSEVPRSVPVIVRRSEPGKVVSPQTQASSPLKVASPQQLSKAALQTMEVKSSKSNISQHSPKNCSSSQSILMSALRPADQQSSRTHDSLERSEPAAKRKSPNQPMAVKKRMKDSAVMGIAEKDFRKAGAATSFSDHCRSFQVNKEQIPFISGSTIHAKVSENVELKIEKVDQLKRVTATHPSGHTVNKVVTNIVSKNGSLSDSERSRSASPRSMSDSSDGRKTSSPNRTHVKCKKAWLQRLSKNSDSPPPQDSNKEAPPVSLPNGHIHSINPVCTTASERHAVVTLSDIQKSIPDKVYDFDNVSTCSENSTASGKQWPKRNRENKRTRRRTDSSSGCPSPQQNGVSKVDEMGDHHKQVTASLKELMSKAPKKRIVTRAHKDKEAFSSVRTLSKQALAKLKRSGEPFLQDGPCTNITPTLMKCRECRMKGSKQSRLNIFCRFYAFRRLRFSNKGNLTIAGFSEMGQYEKDDLSPWLPSWLGEDPVNDVEVSKYIMIMLADKFCELVLRELEAKAAMTSVQDGTVTWKRPVAGVREMCDTCDTTLFNIHWTCSKCGFVVCPDCLKAKKGNSTRSPKAKSPEVWLKCIKDQQHQPEHLMLTQIIPGTALWDIGTLVHEIRTRWNLPLSCPCKPRPVTKGTIGATNGQCREDDQAMAPQVTRDETVPLVAMTTTAPLTASSSTSALDFLAHVATSQSNNDFAASQRDLTNGKAHPSDTKPAPTVVAAGVAPKVVGAGVTTESKGADQDNSSTLRDLLTQTSQSGIGTPGGPLDGSSFLSALIPKSSESKGKHRTMTSTFEDIIATVVEQHIAEPCGKRQGHPCGKAPRDRPGEKPQTGSKNTLTESSFLYPDVPHSWLCDGKLLLLREPANKGNFKIFQEQWGKGAPVLVANVHKELTSSLWHPKFFSKQFGQIENDLVDCRRGTVIQGAPMKDFWDGFEDLTNRLETKQGLPMILKLKDWPPAADFAELLPEHFEDIMANLPLPEYSRRDGVLNLSSRLPDFFVKPDLGPKMYNAYGLASYPSTGTTNLHLDISDAVNVMVHVGVPHRNGEDDDSDAILRKEAAEAVEFHCKDEQTLRRMREGNEIPGALWHIFRAEDTPKIRSFLNVWSQEQGEELRADHDPIHDQSWYLDKEMLHRLKEEYNVEGWTIIQFLGDAVFIPAGGAHQVLNLHSCIKVAEDFVSPEHINECIYLTDEFRHLSNSHSNHEDKLQIKNILYHAIKDAAGVLMGHDPLLQEGE